MPFILALLAAWAAYAMTRRLVRAMNPKKKGATRTRTRAVQPVEKEAAPQIAVATAVAPVKTTEEAAWLPREPANRPLLPKQKAAAQAEHARQQIEAARTRLAYVEGLASKKARRPRKQAVMEQQEADATLVEHPPEIILPEGEGIALEMRQS